MLGKLINTCHVYTARMNPALNGSSAQQHFERSNAIEIRNGIMFDFYPGLPHILALMNTLYSSLHTDNLDSFLDPNLAFHCDKKLGKGLGTITATVRRWLPQWSLLTDFTVAKKINSHLVVAADS